MVTTTKNNITYSVYKNVFDLLKGKATTSKFGSSVQPTITAAYIDKVPTFPQVVIGQPGLDVEDFVFDRSSAKTSVSLVLDVYTSGKSKNKDLSLITDNIYEFLTDNKTAGITLTSVSSNLSLSLDNKNKVLNTTVALVFVRR